MDLRHFRYFVTLAETLHFGRAAEILGIAPPTLSVQIQEIERTLSARLFTRTKRSVALTAVGEMFLPEARHALDQAAAAITVGRRAGRGELGRIDVGYIGSAVYDGTMQRLLAGFRRTHPDVQVTATERPMDALPGMIVEGRIDVGFVRLPMDLPRGLAAHGLARDLFCVALPGDHPMADAGRPLVPADLAKAFFVRPEQDAGMREVGRRGGFVPAVLSTPGSLVAVLAQVSLGNGLAVVPDLLARAVRMPNVVFRPLSGAPIASELAVLHRVRESSPAVLGLIRCFPPQPDAESPFDGGSGSHFEK